MNAADVFGYIASFLVFTTFYMKRMIPLRLIAIGSNIIFICYGYLDGLTPILLLHGALLPLNVMRLIESRRLIAEVVKTSGEEFSMNHLLPLMQRREIGKSDILFQVGDPASVLYYVLQGTIILPEFNKELGPGSFLGEFALFSDSERRTATAVAKTDCVVMALTKAMIYSALVQHPHLGIQLLKMITTRTLENAGMRSPSWPSASG